MKNKLSPAACYCVTRLLLLVGLLLASRPGMSQQLFQRHYQHIGETVLLQLQTACIKGRFVPLTQEPTTFVAYLKFPDKIRIEWAQGRVRWTDTYVAGMAYSRQNGETVRLSDQESYDLQWMLRSTSPLRGYQGGNGTVGEERWNTKDYYKFVHRTDSSHVEFLLDKTSYEIVLERILSTKKPDAEAQEIKYLRYMDLGGVRVPAVFVLQTEEGDADLIYDEVLLGYPLTDDFFK